MQIRINVKGKAKAVFERNILWVQIHLLDQISKVANSNQTQAEAERPGTGEHPVLSPVWTPCTQPTVDTLYSAQCGESGSGKFMLMFWNLGLSSRSQSGQPNQIINFRHLPLGKQY